MEKQEIRELFSNVFIEKPCGVNWNEMSGDEKIRTCAQCNLKVHNLSGMNEREAALVLKKRQSERTCVYFRRKDDGTIAVDNCPEKFKNARNQICIVVASLLICTAQAIYLSSAHAGSLVVHEAFSNFHLRPSDFADHRAFGLDRYPNDLHHMIEFGYDSALEFSRSITAISMILVAFFPTDKIKRHGIRRTLLELFALATVPILVDLVGKYLINNTTGGLSGGM